MSIDFHKMKCICNWTVFFLIGVLEASAFKMHGPISQNGVTFSIYSNDVSSLTQEILDSTFSWIGQTIDYEWNDPGYHHIISLQCI